MWGENCKTRNNKKKKKFRVRKTNANICENRLLQFFCPLLSLAFLYCGKPASKFNLTLNLRIFLFLLEVLTVRSYGRQKVKVGGFDGQFWVQSVSYSAGKFRTFFIFNLCLTL